MVRVVAAVGAVVVGVVLIGCGGSDGPPRASETLLDLRKIERRINHNQREATPNLRVGRATCPRDPEVPAGARIRCHVEVEGVPVPQLLSIKAADDHAATYSLRPERSFLVTKQVEAKLTAPLRRGASADCGEVAIRLYEVGTTFPCRVRLRGRPSRSLNVKVTEPGGSFVVEVSGEVVASPSEPDGKSMKFVVPPGFRQLSTDTSGTGRPTGSTILRLARGNEIILAQFRLDRPAARVFSDRQLRAMSKGVTNDLRSLGMRVIGPVRPNTRDGAPGILLVARPRTPDLGSKKTQVDYHFLVRGHDQYLIGCMYTPPRDDELLAGCRELLATVELRPFRPSG